MTQADSFQHGEFYRNDDPPEEHYDEDALEDGIENFRQIWEEVIGCEVTADTPDLDHIPRIQKALFKGTTCGISFWHIEGQGIGVAGYAEGSDAELPQHNFTWGQFNKKMFWDAVKIADEEGCAEWHLANAERGEEGKND